MDIHRSPKITSHFDDICCCVYIGTIYGTRRPVAPIDLIMKTRETEWMLGLAGCTKQISNYMNKFVFNEKLKFSLKIDCK